MSVKLVTQTKNTRGRDSREIKFNVIGVFEDKVIERELWQVMNPDGTPKMELVDGKQEEVWEERKDKDGKLTTWKETIKVLKTEGILTDIGDALELVGLDKDGKPNEQRMLDLFVIGYNEESERLETDKDELDPYCVGMSEADAKSFKRAARGFAKTTGFSALESAEMIKSARDKKLAAMATA